MLWCSVHRLPFLSRRLHVSFRALAKVMVARPTLDMLHVEFSGVIWC